MLMRYSSILKIKKQQIENTKVLDPEGNDVTPDKLKKIQRDQNKRS